MQKRWFAILCGFSLTLGGVHAQQSERPGNSLDNPIDSPRDISGLSIKNPRIRIVHTTDPWLEGGSMYLQQVDPWLGYMWGKSLTQRNFRERDGVYGDSGKIDGILLPDGVTKMMDRSHSNSCGSCHNVPYRDGGAGMTIAKNGATGRNTPHMYGTGIMEMIGLQMRLQALAIADTNRDGWISRDEMKGKRLVLKNLPAGISGEAVDLDYGSFDDENGDGQPDLNPIFWPYFVDKNGQRMAYARNLKYTDVAGYGLEVQVYGFGTPYAPYRPPVSTTIRSFTLTPFDIHSGMQACDPTTTTSPKRNGLALVSNAGAQQFISAAGKDRGAVLAKTKTGWRGVSLDDPDRDGYCEEISEGDLDATEWYLLNHPNPTRHRQNADTRAGEKLFHKIGCASCHTADWHLLPGNPGAADYTQRFDGDRRFFDLDVSWHDENNRFEAKVNYLVDTVQDAKGLRRVPKRGAYTVRGIYSDFKYHDVGEDFYQMQYDGSIVRKWRTPPLWGIGSTAPYGHDGADHDLETTIRRHGGEALESRLAFAKLTELERKQVICFLQSLVLYQTDQLACDVDGDGKIEPNFFVQGVNTGLEKFNPEWMFKIPSKIEGEIRNIQGITVRSFALTNLRESYGLALEFLRDTDGDGFPDVIDQEPTIRGYRDGAK